MLGVVEPMSNGIGGDLFCIYWDNKQKKLFGLNASGEVPIRPLGSILLSMDINKFHCLELCPGRFLDVSVAGRPLTIVLDRWLSKSS